MVLFFICAEGCYNTYIMLHKDFMTLFKSTEASYCCLPKVFSPRPRITRKQKPKHRDKLLVEDSEHVDILLEIQRNSVVPNMETSRAIHSHILKGVNAASSLLSSVNISITASDSSQKGEEKSTTWKTANSHCRAASARNRLMLACLASDSKTFQIKEASSH